MGKRHGRKDESGRILRRGNNSGSLFQKKAGGVYYMRFTERDADGVRRRVVFSTGTDQLDAARDALNEKAKSLGFGNNDERHVDAILKARRDLDAHRIKIQRERAEAEAQAKAEADAAAKAEAEKRAVTFSEAFACYRTSKKRPDSGADTLRHYEGQFDRFVAWVKAHHPDVVKMRDFTPAMAEQFISDLERTQSRNTRNKYLVFLRMFWRVMRWNPDAQLAVDPWDGIRTLTQTPDEVVRRELTVEELDRIAGVINSGEALPVIREKGNAERKAGNIRDVFTYKGESIRDELRLLFAVGIYTGQRLGDCASMEWAGEDSSIDIVRGIVNVTPRKTKRRYKRRVIIPMHLAFAVILSEIPRRRHNGPLMPDIAGMYATDAARLSRTVQAIFTAAGIETNTDAPEAGTRARIVVGYHSLRHTFSSVMLNAGVSPALVDAMLCHAKGSMTMRYYHEHAEALARAVAYLPLLPQFAVRPQSVIDAARNAPQLELMTAQAITPDASCGILDAIREHLDGASVAELKRAVAVINNAIAKKSEVL